MIDATMQLSSRTKVLITIAMPERKSLIGVRLPVDGDCFHHETSPHPVPVAHHVTNSGAEWSSEADLSLSGLCVATEYIMLRSDWRTNVPKTATNCR